MSEITKGYKSVALFHTSQIHDKTFLYLGYLVYHNEKVYGFFIPPIFVNHP